ncbi:4-alpha-glucanotransferase [Bifidobacterium sp.]|uniref:4-alpha-glucanotransferase n=1 Tax=Bifidobacterium sp. TaxID=41200 RepID=UPI002A91AE4F|nr:4-alpha-glucanotransferase [Bifidobacterium sp.]MDY5368040.1 4-alpha-glucanotransferase [Bifidobacterium sp.]
MSDQTASSPSSQDVRREESPERLARPLIRLAKASGISTSYIDQLGTYVEIRDEVLVSVLAALGVDASSDDAIEASLETSHRASCDQLVPPTVVVFSGAATRVPVHAATAAPELSLTLENGEAYDGDLNALLIKDADADPAIPHAYTLTMPGNLPAGYHTLHVADGNRSADATVLCAPARIPVPEPVAQHHRWGWMTQMYSVRSKESWGVGDYGDLRELLHDAGKQGADFMLINPIHAGTPIPPIEPSPYLPESRRFLNVTYIRPQQIEEYAELDPDARAQVDALHDSVKAANDNPDPLDLNASWTAKRKALWVIYQHGRSAERQAAFDAFVKAAGPDLDAFAAWCVAFEVWGAPWEEDKNPWFSTLNRDSPEVAELVREHQDLFDFQRWLQWIADEQVAQAQAAAKDAGMALGLMQDMAVGVHAYGVDVWWNPERFAVGSVTVGCPPDFYNQQGQDWGQPPFNPRYLERTGYRVYREMVHNVFAHAGAVRIDHVLGLFRLWWIPKGEGAKGGAYVTYNYRAMLAVLSIEASRVGGMVIGEDLGTVPAYVSQVLADHGVLGTVVEWFARVNNSPTAGDPYADPSTYRKYALASVTTHDLPPTAGYLEFEHVKLREELHLLSEPVEEFQKAASAERDAMLKLLVDGGWLDADAAQDVPAHEQEIVEAMHRMLLNAPSLLLQAALVDGTGEHHTQNQPGTSTEYCNWRVPLHDADGNLVHTDEVFKNPRVLSLAAVMRGE